MPTAGESFATWFAKLSDEEKLDVVLAAIKEFKKLEKKGIDLGPLPRSTKHCPTCTCQ